MATWLISRHPGAIDWIKQQGIPFDHHLSHLDATSQASIAAGDTVIGSLPVNLAAQICNLGAHYWHLSLLIPESMRGQELSADQLTTYQAQLQPFKINQTGDVSLSNIRQALTETATLSRTTQNEWLDKLFKAYIFNSANLTTAEQQADKLLDQARRLPGSSADFLAHLERIAKQGKHALNLAAALVQRIKQGYTEQELNDWIDKQSASQSQRIIRHLRITLNKQLAFKREKKQQFQANRHFKITLPHTTPVNGLHPQSIRALTPSNEWDIYIDETGTQFSTDARLLNETDSTLGRIIALILPQPNNLAPLNQSIHAVDLALEEIQSLLLNIMQSNAGILGATLKQDLLSDNWIAAIQQLIRWMLMMLPMDNAPTKVRIYIEQRKPFDNTQQLLALEETLSSELKVLLPERFNKLQLQLLLMDKAHPYNGYVDVIANCWGSSNSVKRQLLARTGWRGNCLLQSSQIAAIERLYQKISRQQLLAADDWFDLCQILENEPEHSLLHDMLQQAGRNSQNQPDLWREYLAEVQQRLKQKRFTPIGLNTALNWLNSYLEPQQELPLNVQLTLYSIQLAAENHLGHDSLFLVNKLLPLIKHLKDENAPLACQALLRIAVRSTHLFDFGATIPLIKQWLDYPVAVPGLLNHAKLHSTLGQLHAFLGQHQAAQLSFAQAISSLNLLADPEQRARELTQTTLYQAIHLQDIQHPDAVATTLALVEQHTQQSGLKAIERLARSESGSRFMHYLVLRLLIKNPALVDERHAYLAQATAWANDDGHPWPLINAYRAWLLVEQTQDNDTAQLYLQQAINQSVENQQPMLTWIGHCLHALGSSLMLPLTLPAETLPPAPQFPSSALSQLQQAADHQQRLAALQHVLPFNFH